MDVCVYYCFLNDHSVYILTYVYYCFLNDHTYSTYVEYFYLLMFNKIYLSNRIRKINNNSTNIFIDTRTT